MQGGSYDDMIKAATRFYTGHAQINQRDFVTDNKLEQTVPNASALREQLQNRFPLVALPRVQAFGIVSKDERSIGGMLVGVDFMAEAAQLDLFKKSLLVRCRVRRARPWWVLLWRAIWARS